MEVIDSNWLRARLSGDHGEQRQLADAVGLSPDKITKILTGKRTIRPHEIPRFVAYFTPKPRLGGFAETAPDFRGPIAKPVSPGQGLAALMSALAPNAHNATIYQMSRSEPGASLLSGDLLLVELGDNASDGDLVLVTKNDPETDTQFTVLRKYQRPYLLTLDIGDQRAEPAEQSLESAIVAVVKASARPAR